MHIAEVVTIAKSLPLLRLNTYKSLILSYSADYRRIFTKNNIALINHIDIIVLTAIIAHFFNLNIDIPVFHLLLKYFISKEVWLYVGRCYRHYCIGCNGSFSWIVILMFAVKLLNNCEKTHKKRNIIALVSRNRHFSYAKPPL